MVKNIPLYKSRKADKHGSQASRQAGRQAGPLSLDLTSGWKQPESDNKLSKQLDSLHHERSNLLQTKGHILVIDGNDLDLLTLEMGSGVIFDPATLQCVIFF